MAIEFQARHRQGDFTLDAAFASERGLIALFGRSGAGKTTVVNILAGLIRPQHGRVRVDGRPLLDTSAGLFVRAHRRRIGYVFQDGRLFPHLSVRRNLLYGQWLTPRRERFLALRDVVDLLGIETLLARRPATLSGGEQQRVAIGRALLTSPRLLLMDEPLASLDNARRAEIMPFIERLRDRVRVPIVYVSHSLDEVARLADRMVLLEDGRVRAEGPTADLLTRLDLRPMIGRFEAGALLTARIVAHDHRLGLSLLEHPAGTLKIPALDLAVGSRVRLRVRARDVALAVGEVGALSIRNRLRARVVEIGTEEGAIVDIVLDCGGETLVARITRESVEELAIAPGAAVTALVKAISVERRGIASLPPA